MLAAFKGRYWLSSYAVVFCSIIIVLLGTLFYPKYEKSGSEATISWDVAGYYAYLPGLFIYEDLKDLTWLKQMREKYSFAPYDDQFFEHDSGGNVLKYSAGMAVLYSPAFFTANSLAVSLGYPKDGYSFPYQWALAFQGLLVSILGLILLRKILVRYFSDGSVSLSIIVISLGTNFLEYASITNAMSHNYLFMLYAYLIYLSIRFFESPMYRYAMKIGVVVGLMALCRPTELMAGLIPLIWYSSFRKYHLRARAFFIKDQWPKIMVAIGIVVLISLIQFNYWHRVTGEWVVFSYQDQGFSWLKPHLLDGIFNFRTGWLIYTPLMFLALIGFVPLFNIKQRLFTPPLIYIIIFIYITFTRDLWWHGWSIGQGTMVQVYPLLAFPLTALFQSMDAKFWRTASILSFASLSTYFNFWLIYQTHHGGLLNSGRMSESNILRSAGRFDVLPERVKLLDARIIYEGPIVQPIELVNVKDEICLNADVQFSPFWTAAVNQENGKYYRFQTSVKTDDQEGIDWKMTQMIIRYFHNGENVKNDFLRIQRIVKNGEQTVVWLDSRCSQIIDKVEVSLWHASSTTTLCAKDFTLIQHKGE